MKSYKILVVEDEAIILMALEEALNNMGYMNIKTASDAPDALEYLSNEKFDIVLMDINLGIGVDGIDVINEIKEHLDIPVIYITGNSDYKTVNKAKYSEPDGFILKPFNEMDLKITLEMALHKAASKLEKNQRKNTPYEFSFEEDKNNLVIRLGPNGEIYYINSKIKNYTHRPAIFYNDKTIDSSKFDPFFASTLNNILNEVKNANRHLFYCNLKTENAGERVMEVVVTPDNYSNDGFKSYVLKFKDVTDRHEPLLVNDREVLTQQEISTVKTKDHILKSKRNEILQTMTKREKEILDLVMQGMSNKLIGEKLNISPKTVSIHRSNLMKKVNAKNAAQLVKIAVNNGISANVLRAV